MFAYATTYQDKTKKQSKTIEESGRNTETIGNKEIERRPNNDKRTRRRMQQPGPEPVAQSRKRMRARTTKENTRHPQECGRKLNRKKN